MVLFKIWAPQTMKRLLRKPRRQKGIKGSSRALERVGTLSLTSRAARKIAKKQRHTAGSWSREKLKT